MTVVLVDAENVRRSVWPNMAPEELVERCRAWAEVKGVEAVVVFDGEASVGESDEWVRLVGSGGESADEVLVRKGGQLRGAGEPFWLVTSDRELRDTAGRGAERVVGGGSFARSLRR